MLTPFSSTYLLIILYMSNTLLGAEHKFLKNTIEYDKISCFKNSTGDKGMHENDSYLGLGGEDSQKAS